MPEQRWLIVRKAVIMEDQGCESFERVCKTEQEAKDWIKAQEGGYFSPGDFYIQPVDEY